MNFLDIDFRLKKWIEEHRIKWIFILITFGVGLGLGQNVLLGADSRTALMLTSIYPILLVSCELIMGGSGID